MADETNQLRVRLVTPERTLFEHAATAVELRRRTGIRVLYGHAPLVAELGAGDVIVHCGTDIVRRNTDNSIPLQTSVGALSKCFPTASPSSPPMPSSPTRSMCPAPSSNWTAASRCGRKPAKAKTLTRSLRVISEAEAKDRLGRRQALSSYTVQLLSNKTPCSIEQGVFIATETATIHRTSTETLDSASFRLRRSSHQCLCSESTSISEPASRNAPTPKL